MMAILHRLLAFLPVLLWLPLAESYNVHDKFVNGVYELTFMQKTDGKEGTLVQYDIDATDNYTAKYRDDKIPLPINKLFCADYQPDLLQYHDPAESVIAMEMLANWCEMYNPRKGAIVVAVFKSAIWYVCNWDVQHRAVYADVQRCSRTEIYEASNQLDKQCHADQAGELQTGGWLKHYGRGVRMGMICLGLERWG